MTDKEKVRWVRDTTKTIESIDKILRRIKQQRDIFEYKHDGTRLFIESLSKFFSVFTSELNKVITPKELDADLLDVIEIFYLGEKIELEQSL